MSTITLQLTDSFIDEQYHLHLKQKSELKGFSLELITIQTKECIVTETSNEMTIEPDQIAHAANMLELMAQMLRNWEQE